MAANLTEKLTDGFASMTCISFSFSVSFLRAGTCPPELQKLRPTLKPLEDGAGPTPVAEILKISPADLAPSRLAETPLSSRNGGKTQQRVRSARGETWQEHSHVEATTAAAAGRRPSPRRTLVLVHQTPVRTSLKRVGSQEGLQERS